MKKVLFLLLIGFFSLHAQWVSVTSGLTGDIWGVDWADANTVWIVDATGAVARSIDGGITFSSAGSVGAEAYSIAALSATTALVATGPNSGNGAIFRTTNGGTNWTNVYTVTGAWFNAIDNLSSTLLWAQSDPTDGSFHIVKSTDAGATWALAANRPVAPATNVFGANTSFYSLGTTAWFGTGGASGATLANRVYKSTTAPDGPWTFATVGAQFSGSVAFSSANGFGLVGFWQATNTLSRSADGGANYSTITPSIGLTRGLAFLPGTTWAWAATSTGLWRTTNNGDTWSQETLPVGIVSTVMPSAFNIGPNNYKFIVGGNGGALLRNTLLTPVELTSFTASLQGTTVQLDWVTATEVNNQGFEIQRKLVTNGVEGTFAPVGFKAGKGTTSDRIEYTFTDNIQGLTSEKIIYRLKQVDFGGQHEFSDEIEVSNAFVTTDYQLQQNYPNPFNPSTMVTFSLPEDNFVSVKVFNSLGQEVAELFNGMKNAGTHSVSFDGSDLGSGIYYAVLRSSDSKVNRTIKMSLMK